MKDVLNSPELNNFLGQNMVQKKKKKKNDQIKAKKKKKDKRKKKKKKKKKEKRKGYISETSVNQRRHKSK